MALSKQGLLGYRPELDALRAIAVLGVMYAHMWDESSTAGALGVRLFFVLSGFLITDILLNLREQAGADRGSAFFILRNFFIRRALRLWPAYFLVLGVATIVNFQNIRPVAGWHALFLSNVLFALRNEHLPWAMSAWWSLSVEEQFYIFWPALMCLPPRKWLPWLLGALIYIGVFWHFAMEYFGIHGLAAYYLPPAAFVALGGGAALALVRRHLGHIPRVIEYVGWLSLPLVTVLTVLQWTNWIWAILNVLPMLALVSWGVRGSATGMVHTISNARPVLWIGRVSYGIYLYHIIVIALIFEYLPMVPSLTQRGPVLFLVGTALSIMVASLLWLVLEAPCNRLKRFFPYQVRAKGGS